MAVDEMNSGIPTGPRKKMTNSGDNSAVRGRLVAVEHQVTQQANRIANLEEWKHGKEIADAKQETELAAFTREVKQKFETLTSGLEEVKKSISRVGWLVLAAVILAVLDQVLKHSGGGF